MCRERFVKSNPPKLQVLCGKKGGAEIIQLCLSRRTVHWPNTRPVCRMSLDHKRITGWVRKEKWWKKHTVHVIRRRRHAFCPSTGRWNYACTTGSESPSHAKTNWFKKKNIYIYTQCKNTKYMLIAQDALSFSHRISLLFPLILATGIITREHVLENPCAQSSLGNPALKSTESRPF